MLRMVYQSQTVPNLSGKYKGVFARGMFLHEAERPKSSWSIFLSAFSLGNNDVNWAILLLQWDAKTGQFVQKVEHAPGSWAAPWFSAVNRSRYGKLWIGSGGGTYTLGQLIIKPKDESEKSYDPTPVWEYGSETFYPSSHFEGLAYYGTQFQIDEDADRFVVPHGAGIGVWELKSGKFLFEREVPGGMVAFCLEDIHRLYILCGYRQLILLDYVRNDVMGAVKIPKPHDPGSVIGGPDGYVPNAWGTWMVWDKLTRQLLVWESEPDAEDGTPMSRIRGYRMVPETARITKPIPLRVPRKGKVIPVMCQVVGDMNEGVAGYVVKATVTGDAALVGTPITDGGGWALARVRCGLATPPVGGGHAGSDEPTVETLTYTLIDAAGTTPDIGVYDGHQYLVYEVGGNLRVLRDGLEQRLVQLIAPGAFPRVVGKSCIFRDGPNTVYWDDLDQGESTWQTLGTHGSGDHSVTLNPMMLAWQAGPAYEIRRRTHIAGPVSVAGHGNLGGLSRYSDHAVRMDEDADRIDKDGMLWGHQAAFSSSLIACEGLTNGVVVRMDDEPNTEVRLWDGEPSKEPRIVVYGADVAVVCHGGSGVRLAQFPTTDILNYVPGDAAGWGLGAGSVGSGSAPLAPVIGRDLWFGYFYAFSVQYHDNPNAPGNWTVVTDPVKIGPAIANVKKLVVSGGAIAAAGPSAAQVVGVLCYGETVSELEDAAIIAFNTMPVELAGTPIIGMLGSTTMPTSPVAGVDWLALQCYVKRNETAAACQARVQACMNALGSAHSYVLVGQSFSSNSELTQDSKTLVDAQYIPASLAKADTRVVGILMYSDGGYTGTRTHESWRPIHRAIYAGIGEDGTSSPIGGDLIAPGTFNIKMSIEVPAPYFGGGADTTELPGTAPPVVSGGGGSAGGHPWMTVNGSPLDYRGVSAFASFVRWLDGDVGCIANICTWAKAQDYTVIRVLGMFGHPLWVSHGYDYYPGDGTHSESAYYDGLKMFAQFIASQGLTLEWVPFADVGYIPKYETDQTARLSHVEKCAQALSGIGPVVIEICNEPPFNGLSNATTLAALAGKVKEVDSSRMVALGAESMAAWQEMTYAIAPADYLTFHGNRTDDWAWPTQYYGGAPLTQSARFPIEDEPQHPEDDPEVGHFFALGCVSRILEFGVTFHFSDGLWGDVPSGQADVCGKAMAEGLNTALYSFGGTVFKDFESGSPLTSGSVNPTQIVGRKTATSMQLIAMGCPAGWTPTFASGWTVGTIMKRGTSNNAQFITGTSSGGSGGSTGCPERTKDVPLYDGSSIVNDYAAAHPDQLANSCQPPDGSGTWDFMDGVVAALQAADPRFGYNGKRGNASDLSHDAISYYCGSGSPISGSKNCYVIDIIGNHCGGSPGPAWINQSADDQACGAWVPSR